MYIHIRFLQIQVPQMRGTSYTVRIAMHRAALVIVFLPFGSRSAPRRTPFERQVLPHVLGRLKNQYRLDFESYWDPVRHHKMQKFLNLLALVR